MSDQAVNIAMAVTLLVLAVPATILARAAARGTVASRALAVARELGLEYLGPIDSEKDPRINRIASKLGDPDRLVANPMRGVYRGRHVFVAELIGRHLVSAVAVWALAALLIGALGLVGLVAAMILLLLAPRWFRRSSNHLLILFPEPVPGVRDLTLDANESGAFGGRGGGVIRLSGPSPGPLDDPDGPGTNPGKPPAWKAPQGDPPPPFLERAERVIVGRGTPWRIQLLDGRLAVGIAGWRAGTRTRPARSYRAVLDDAVSLRDALDPPDSPAPAEQSPAPRKPIRAALERIRGASGPDLGT